MHSALVLLLALLAICAACTSADEGNIVPINSDPPTTNLGSELFEAAQALPVGDSLALSTVTEFDWDRVHVFSAGTKKSLVNEAVGADVYTSDLDGRYGVLTEKFLAVYTLEGAVVEVGQLPAHFQILQSQLDASTATVTRETSATTLGNNPSGN